MHVFSRHPAHVPSPIPPTSTRGVGLTHRVPRSTVHGPASTVQRPRSTVQCLPSPVPRPPSPVPSQIGWPPPGCPAVSALLGFPPRLHWLRSERLLTDRDPNGVRWGDWRACLNSAAWSGVERLLHHDASGAAGTSPTRPFVDCAASLQHTESAIDFAFRLRCRRQSFASVPQPHLGACSLQPRHAISHSQETGFNTRLLNK